MTAPNDVYVYSSTGPLTGTVNAGRHAAVIAMGNQAVLNLDAGMDAYIFSYGSLDLFADAGRDIAVIGLDRVKGTIDAGASSFVSALSTVTTLNQTAGEYASLISWDSVQGPSAISGNDGVFVWTYGNFYGDIASSAGWATLTSYGDVSLSSVTAETDAYVTLINDFGIDSDITAGESAFILSFGAFEGTVTAAADAILLGEGSFDVDLTAGKDVYVYTFGDVQGSYEAGRDASIITFSNFNGRLHAGRDVGGEIYGLQMPGVWAKGNINGVIDANRNIGYDDRDTIALFDATKYPVIFAGGSINADLYARNTSHDPKGGKIGRVAAHGTIGGLFKAEHSIDAVLSSDDIFTLLDAPVVAGNSPNDPSVLTDYPLPATPASVKADILSEAADAHALVLTEADAIAIANGDLMDVLKDLEADLNDVTGISRSAILQANSDAELAMAEAAATAKVAYRLYQKVEAAEQAVEFVALRAAAAKSRQHAVAELDKLQKSREGEHQKLLVAKTDAQQNLAKGEEQFKALREKEIKKAYETSEKRAKTWDEWEHALAKVERGERDARVDRCAEAGYSNAFVCFLGENIIRPLFTDEFLVSADNTDLFWATTVFSATTVVSALYVAPAVATAAGGGLVGAVVSGGVTAAGEYVFVRTLLHDTTGGRVPLPTVQQTVEFGVAGAVTGGIAHGVGAAVGAGFRKVGNTAAGKAVKTWAGNVTRKVVARFRNPASRLTRSGQSTAGETLFEGGLEGARKTFDRELQEVFEEAGAGEFQGIWKNRMVKTQFDDVDLAIYFQRDAHLTNRVVGEEVQHAVDFTNGATNSPLNFPFSVE